MATRALLTRAESELMQLLWSSGASTVQQLLERLDRPVAYTTVLTLVRILEKKGYVEHVANPEGGRAYLYRAKVAPGQTRQRHLKDLVDRLFGGDVRGLMVGLLDEEALSAEELRALRKQIDAQLKGKERK